jgi:hypothetical protein
MWELPAACTFRLPYPGTRLASPCDVIVLPSPTGLISCPADVGYFAVLRPICTLHARRQAAPKRAGLFPKEILESKKQVQSTMELKGYSIVFMPVGVQDTKP